MEDLTQNLKLSAVKYVAIFFVLFIIQYLVKPRKRTPTEPALIPSWIPYIGHPIGMFLYGGRYLRDIRYDLPGYDLRSDFKCSPHSQQAISTISHFHSASSNIEDLCCCMPFDCS